MSRITDAGQNLPATPLSAGLRYAFDHRLEPALREEIRLQFERFAALGFKPAYWDGHTHLHLHPTVLRLALPEAVRGGFRFTRLVREPGSKSRLGLIFAALSRAALGKLQARKMGFNDRVYGLSETGQMNNEAFERILNRLPEGASELYFHPGVDGLDLAADTLLETIRARKIVLRAADTAAR